MWEENLLGMCTEVVNAPWKCGICDAWHDAAPKKKIFLCTSTHFIHIVTDILKTLMAVNDFITGEEN